LIHASSALTFAFAGQRMLVRRQDPSLLPSLAEVAECGPFAAGPFDMGRIGDRPAVAVALAQDTGGAGLQPMGLRELFGVLPDSLMSLAARASQTLEWSVAHAFCGRCGTATEYSQTELARTCPACGSAFYPRLTPAVITLISKGPEILLARGLASRSGFYSLIAGFVEPGETLEQAVEREVFEEVGIAVKDITYFGSQSWPFPSQMMVGFTANHAGGSLRINEAELMDARWFPVDGFPDEIEVPSTFSISGRLIRHRLPGR
jgi:NAD+ diphosphatase